MPALAQELFPGGVVLAPEPATDPTEPSDPQSRFAAPVQPAPTADFAAEAGNRLGNHPESKTNDETEASTNPSAIRVLFCHNHAESAGRNLRACRFRARKPVADALALPDPRACYSSDPG